MRVEVEKHRESECRATPRGTDRRHGRGEEGAGDPAKSAVSTHNYPRVDPEMRAQCCS